MIKLPHTPTPWHVEQGFGSLPNIIRSQATGEDLTTGMGVDDQRYICLACNYFEQLVQATEALLVAAAHSGVVDTSPLCKLVDAIVKDALK